MYNIKEMVSDGKKVRFTHYKNYELWYITETGFEFPVPTDDCGDATFPAEDKAILYMRYIRKHVNMLQEAQKESGWTPPYHVTGTDNPVDFPNTNK